MLKMMVRIVALAAIKTEMTAIFALMTKIICDDDPWQSLAEKHKA